MTTTHPTPVLKSGVIYNAGDRFVCAKMRCAGQTALYTGRTVTDVLVVPVSGRDIIEHAALFGTVPFRCDCGTYRATFSTRTGLSVVRVGGEL